MKENLMSSARRMAARAGAALERHPRKLTALVAALMLGAGGGAFAVAELGPDAASLPVRQVLEAVEPLSLDAQRDALAAFSFNLYTSEIVRSSDTPESLLGRLGINDPAAVAFLRADRTAWASLFHVPGRQVRAEASDDHNLQRLTVRWALPEATEFQRLVVERQPSGNFASRVESAPFTASLRVGSGTIRTSLFAAADEASIPDQVTVQMVDLFADIDFHRSLRVGDRFSVVYETLEADGEPMRTGRVISAEFVNAGRTREAMWFEEPGKRGGYFDFDGESLERLYLASPMAISRVTSGFKMRFHPILKTWRRHTGVDYGAPTGTPVRTVGDGVVVYAGRKGGYGNVVEIDHGRGDTTLYAHLSRINVRRGQAVERGQNIGAVGATGWATGPHLHFEFKQRGAHRDPLQVARKAEARVLSASARPEFMRQARALRSQLAAAAAATLVASAR